MAVLVLYEHEAMPPGSVGIHDANPRTGKTRSNATLQQRLNGSRRTVPPTSMNSASATAPSAPAPASGRPVRVATAAAPHSGPTY
jgi:hypothetical protein